MAKREAVRVAAPAKGAPRATAGTAKGGSGRPIDLGTRRELFVDDYLIERRRNVELRLQKPVPRNVAIDHDVPWEGNTCCYHTVFQDGKLFRLYFRGSHYDPNSNRIGSQVVCYAESRDGVEWYRPELGLVNSQGSTRNNILWEGIGSHNFAPFRDDSPKCRDGERYKAMGSGQGGLYAFKSPTACTGACCRRSR